MNMTLSKRGDYVVRSAIALAQVWEGGKFRKVREVVAEMAVPQTFASQILSDLVRVGLAESKAGKDGGYRLSRAPSDITLLDVIEAGEGPLRSERCALGDGPCRWDDVCPLHNAWSEATNALREVLRSTTLRNIQEADLKLSKGTHTIPLDSHRHTPKAHEFKDSVQVELSMVQVKELLLDSSEWLAEIAKDSYSDGEKLRLLKYPTTPNWISDEVLFSVIELERDSNGENFEPSGNSKLNSVFFSFAWETSRHKSTSCPRIDGTLELIELDSERSEVILEGKFHQILDRSLSENYPDIYEKLTQATIRGFLRRLARAFESRSSTLILSSKHR